MADRAPRRRRVDRPWAWTSPAYRALDLTFRLRVEDAAAGRFLAGALAALETDGDASREYRIFDDSTGGDGRWVVHVDGAPVGVPGTGGAALQWLLWDVNRSVVDASRRRYLLLHAGAVARDGTAVLLAGRSGAGKTTLTAGLVAAGFSYLSDESPGLDPRSGLLHPYHKPLAVDAGARSVLAALEPTGDDAPPAGWAWDQWTIDARRVPGGGGLAGPARVALVVLPRYERCAPTRLEPITRAEALLALADNAFNFRDRPLEHLRALAALVGAARCHRLVTGDLDGAVAAVTAAFHDAPAPAVVPARSTR